MFDSFPRPMESTAYGKQVPYALPLQGCFALRQVPAVPNCLHCSVYGKEQLLVLMAARCLMQRRSVQSDVAAVVARCHVTSLAFGGPPGRVYINALP